MSPTLQLKLEAVSGHGQDDYESDYGQAVSILAVRDDQILGKLDLNLCGDCARVRWIETREDALRQGVARALLAEAQRLYAPMPFTTGGFTPEGEALFAALGMECAEERDPNLEDEDEDEDY